MTNPTRYLTVNEARAYLAEHNVKISGETLRRWARADKLGVRYIGGRIHFPASEVEALVAKEYAA